MVTIGRTSNTYCYDDYYEQPAQHRQSYLDSKHAQGYEGGSEGPYHGGAGLMMEGTEPTVDAQRSTEGAEVKGLVE